LVLVVIVAGSIALNIVKTEQRRAQKAMAREDAARRELNIMADALERFRVDVARYPTNEEGLRFLARKPAAFEASGSIQTYWFGPYLENVPEVDPWGNDYVYHTSDGGRSFELFSPGPGGAESDSGSKFRIISASERN
jgi:general secretion pathway protein G